MDVVTGYEAGERLRRSVCHIHDERTRGTGVDHEDRAGLLVTPAAFFALVNEIDVTRDREFLQSLEWRNTFFASAHGATSAIMSNSANGVSTSARWIHEPS